ncbi:MAG: hypothetical protein JSS07_06335 [Proteobacteria bacterium]|nr:hypothetical protein [Pseudomonadota bacterium]
MKRGPIFDDNLRSKQKLRTDNHTKAQLLPNYVYFESKQVKEKHTTQYTGDLDVQHAMQANPRCWKKQEIGGGKQKKIIVLSDFRLEQKKTNCISQIENNIALLFTQGLSVYLWQQDGPIELTKKNIGILQNKNIAKNCTPVHPKKIKSAMAKKQLSPDSILILNIQQLDDLANTVRGGVVHEPSQQTKVDVQEIIKSSFSYPEIIEAIPQIQLVVSEYAPPTQSIVDRWIKKCSEPVKVNYKKFTIKNQTDLDTYYSLEGKMSHLVIDRCAISDLKRLLTHKAIETLELKALSSISVEADIGLLPSIHTLDLHETEMATFNKKKIDHLIRSMPNLKKIIIPNTISCYLEMLRQDPSNSIQLCTSDSCITINNKADVVALVTTLKSLNEQQRSRINTTKIKFDLNELKVDDLFYIINELPCLTSLSVTHLTDESSISLRDNLKLKDITLKYIPWKIVDELLKRSAHLQTLSISSPQEDFIFSENMSFPHLTSLSLEELGTQEYLKLLQNCNKGSPNISSLSLHINSDTEHLSLNDSIFQSFSNLKDLNIIDSCGDPEGFISKFLLDFVNYTPNLQVLAGDIRITEQLLPQLMKLKLRDLNTCRVSSEISLRTLFNKIQTIENFKVDEDDDIGEEFNEEFNNEELNTSFKLKKLIIRNTINVDELKSIVQKAASLKKFEYTKDGCSYLIRKLAENQVLLPALTEAHFPCSDFTQQDYLLLKTIAPNLLSINISGSPAGEAGIHDEDVEIINHLHRNNGNAQPPQVQPPQVVYGHNQSAKGHHVKLDPRLDDLKYNLTHVFTNIHNGTHPVINYYRNSVFDSFQFTTDNAYPFYMENKGDIALENYEDYAYGSIALQKILAKEQAVPTRTTFYGQHELTLSNEFQALPSLNPHELLLALDVKGVPQKEIELCYSKRDNLYYIRKKTPGNVRAKIDYLINVPETVNYQSHEIVENFVQYFRTFQPGTLTTEIGDQNAENFLLQLYNQKLGRCEQLAVMFKYFLQKQCPQLPVRIVCSDCHAYVEVQLGSQWVAYDLGGYPGELTVKEPPAKTGSQEVLELMTLDPKHITWQQEEDASPINADAIAMQALGNEGHNVLIRCQSNEDVQTMCLNVQYLAKQMNRRIYVINHADELVCAQNWLKREKDNTGTTMEGPGGPLYDFLTLTDPTQEPPILLVNWNNFSKDELVRFNKLIGEERFVDDTPLPNECIVVGLYNTKKADRYKGSDFYSRHSLKLTASSEVFDALCKSRFALEFPTGEPSTNHYEIELYDSVNWKEILLGHWLIEAGQLRYKEGELVKALKQGKSVHLRNAPWHIPDFLQFWQEAKIHGCIKTCNETIAVPKSFWTDLNQGQGYDWHKFKGVKFVSTVQPGPPLVINPSNFNQFVEHYDLLDSKPVAHPSLFSQYKQQTLTVFISAPLNTANWHRLLQAAQQHEVKLQLVVAKDTPLPEALIQAFSALSLTQDIEPYPNVQLIQSNDISFSLANLKEKLATAQPLVIDISECTPSDVLYRADATINKTELIFHEKFSPIFEALQNKQTVILKGRLSDELRDALLPLCVQGGITVNGQYRPINGKLYVLAENKLSDVLQTETHNVSLNEKLAHIFTHYPGLNEPLKTAIKAHVWPKEISYDQLVASIDHYQHSTPPSFDYLSAVLTDRTVVHPAEVPLELTQQHVHSTCDRFVGERLAALKQLISRGPVGFICGKTGVGKSTFIDKYVTPENGYKLYHELAQVQAWANDKTLGLKKVLFIDEANIADQDFTLFSGLREHPPRILVNDKLLELTDDHVVIMAGNPMSYGGERRLPQIIAQHGNVCYFDLLPVEYIYQEVIHPIFDAGKIPQDLSDQWGKCILKTYQIISALSTTEVLISPRELKMMAMLLVTLRGGQDPHRIIYDIVYPCLAVEKRQEFDQWFMAQYPLQVLPAEEPKQSSHFSLSQTKVYVMTPSRQTIACSLQHLLAVREFSIQATDPRLRLPGLGGLLLEGDSGVGKSHFLIDQLLKQGYTQIPLKKCEQMNENPPTKGFYVIPANLSFAQKEKLLLAAFDQGLLVVIDEINSCPMMERLLNAILMGYHPKTKQPAKHPGFILLATQNPISMDAREATSRAIARRVFFHEIANYTPEEMEAILTSVFSLLSRVCIKQEIKHHLAALRYALKYHCEPAPVFRDLYNIVDEIALKHKLGSIVGDTEYPQWDIQNSYTPALEKMSMQNSSNSSRSVNVNLRRHIEMN